MTRFVELITHPTDNNHEANYVVFYGFDRILGYFLTVVRDSDKEDIVFEASQRDIVQKQNKPFTVPFTPETRQTEFNGKWLAIMLDILNLPSVNDIHLKNIESAKANPFADYDVFAVS